MISRVIPIVLLLAPAFIAAQAAPDSGAARPLIKDSTPGYVLGPNDQLSVEVTELEQFTGKTFRVDSDGTVSLPFIGRLPVGGKALAKVEEEVTEKLKDQVKEPHVLISVIESRSQPVSIMGAVTSPGVYQLQGGKKLFDLLSMAGGVRNEAGYTLRITRREENGELPLPGAKKDPENHVSTAEVNLRALTENHDAALNIPLAPRDVIDVPKAELIYVIGEVRKAGGFSVSRPDVSALQALSMAEGLGPQASPQNSRILRPVPGSATRQEIAVDLKKLLAGRAEDIMLRPDDVLFVPNNAARRFATKAAEIALQTASGIIIWRGF